MLRRGNVMGGLVCGLLAAVYAGSLALHADEPATGEPAKQAPAAGTQAVATPQATAADAKPAADAQAASDSSQTANAKPRTSKDPPGMMRLSPNYDVWIDPVKKRVVMDGTVCLRQGTLEMFVCLKGTKEHESVVFVDTQAYIVHAGLLAVGAKPGSPARFQPEYKPASGTPIDITCIWTDEKGTVHREPAQQWVRNFHTQKALDSTWVFAGSGFYTDDQTGKKHYLAEGGDFICVSNFPGAMLDLPVESSQANTDLLFEAFTEHIPPRGTRVRLVLTPRPAETKAKGDQ